MAALSKHVLNSPESLVVDSLNGLALLNPSVTLDEKYKVLHQTNPANHSVSIISGGGSGHEPAHSGFVGDGMLTAAVAGTIFASPNVSQIKRALQIVNSGPTSTKGTLVVVKNYTGDVLHFGLATEQFRASAKAPSGDVRVVIIGDDVAVGRKQGGIVGRRGLAGTVLVYKIAGAFARSGGSLDEVEKLAQLVSQNVATYGASLEHCHVPGTEPNQSQLEHNELELGMGIHNEPGFTTLKPYPKASELIAQMLASITSTKESDPDRGFLKGLKLDGKDEVVLLVNNLGSISLLDLGGIVKDAVHWLHDQKFVVRRVLSGTYMTSLNMPGFSLTVLLLPRDDSSGFDADKVLEYLDAPTQAPGWPWHAATEPTIGVDVEHDATVALEGERTGTELPVLKAPDASQYIQAIKSAAQAVIDAEPEITKYDQIAGDGDAGLTLKSGGEGILKAIEQGRIKGQNLIGDTLVVAEVVDEDMGGTSGALYSIFFSALGNSLKSFAGTEDTVTFEIWSKALSEALKVLYKYTPARPPSRTLVGPLAAFISTLESGSSFKKAVEEARTAADATRNQRATIGRGAYVDQEKLGEKRVPDPGASGVATILDAILEAN